MASENPKQPSPKRSAPAASTPSPAPKPEMPPALPKAPPLFRRVDWLAFAITSILVFFGYMYTIAPDLTLQDSGELAVASMYAGVPHPPGYPVWTIYTWFFTVIIPFGNMAWRVAVSSAFAGALSCGIITLMVSRGSSMFIESVAELKNIDRKIENWICFVSGFVAGMLFGFNGFMWSQSVIVEVYSLSMLSLTAGVLCLLRWNYAPHQYRYLYLAWFLAGISVNNHQSLFVITIAMEVLIIATQTKLGRVVFLWNGIFYVAGMILYNKGDLSVLGGNTPVMVIFNAIGIISIFGWIVLSILSKANAAEWLRDVILVGVAIVSVAVGGVKGMLVGTTLVLLIYGAIDLAFWMQKQPFPWGPHWRKGIGIGVSFVVGLAFYVYMPLASMTNPPLNWGYPRTVGGFIHAFTRGQYEKIHPTAGAGRNIAEQTISWITTYSKQCWWFLVRGPIEEFNLVYICIGMIPLFFFRRLQKRERAWLLGMVAFYFVLGPFLVEMFNPAADRQALELNKPFFIASHVFISLAIGYGLTLLTATLVTQYERYRITALIGFGLASLIAIYGVWFTFQETPYSVLRATATFGAVLALAVTAFVAIPRTTAPAAGLLGLLLLMPIHSIIGHWSGVEQRGHYFGYWFGHDMFTPPYKGKDYEKTHQLSYSRKEREELLKTPEGQKRVYPEMTRNTILFGGTDPGRFCPTYMIFCESFIPPKDKPRDPEFDRRDVYIITQNALADATYLQYIRAHYNRSTEPDKPFFSELFRGDKERELNFRTNLLARMFAVPLDNFFLQNGYRIEKARRDRGVYPPVEIHTPSNEESQKSFQEYMNDAQARMAKGQLRPGEDVRVIDNRVQVSGQVAVMAINALLCKVIFDNNPTNEFFVEESFPLDWMYPHLTPFGIIMKLNREPLPELTQEIVDKDHLFWSDYSERLIGNWITHDTPISNITQFAERVYVNKNYQGFKGDPAFVRDDDGQKAFSKLRSSIAGVYAWRVAKAIERGALVFEQRPPSTLNPAEKQVLDDYRRMFREAEFSFKQAYAFCPYSPEALYRYVQLLAGARRFDDALLLAKTSKDLDPVNTGLDRLVEELQKMKTQAGPAAAAQANQQLAQAEAAFRANPNDLNNAAQLAQMYATQGRTQDVLRIADTLLASPDANAQAISFAAQVYQQLPDYVRLEKALEKWTKVTPTPEAFLDYAASQAVLNKRAEAVASLRQALAMSAERLKTNPKAENLALTVSNDQRFMSLKTFPEFQQLLATNK
jgi:tetratricopeptide (TPR) repeat protein